MQMRLSQDRLLLSSDEQIIEENEDITRWTRYIHEFENVADTNRQDDRESCGVYEVVRRGEGSNESLSLRQVELDVLSSCLQQSISRLQIDEDSNGGRENDNSLKLIFPAIRKQN